MNAKRSKSKSATDWRHLASDSDEDIDFTDIPRLGGAFWRKAAVRMPQCKDSVTLRLDHDVLQWFRKAGPGYQTRINAVLRSYVQTAGRM